MFINFLTFHGLHKIEYYEKGKLNIVYAPNPRYFMCYLNYKNKMNKNNMTRNEILINDRSSDFDFQIKTT